MVEYNDVLCPVKEQVFGIIRIPIFVGISLYCDVIAVGDPTPICRGARFVNPTICPANSFQINAVHDCTKPAVYDVQTIFRTAQDRDTASTLALGKKQSVGLVCAYAEAKKQTAGTHVLLLSI